MVFTLSFLTFFKLNFLSIFTFSFTFSSTFSLFSISTSILSLNTSLLPLSHATSHAIFLSKFTRSIFSQLDLWNLSIYASQVSNTSFFLQSYFLTLLFSSNLLLYFLSLFYHFIYVCTFGSLLSRHFPHILFLFTSICLNFFTLLLLSFSHSTHFLS